MVTARTTGNLIDVLERHSRDIRKLRAKLSAQTLADAAHNHDADYSDIAHHHDADYADINHAFILVDEGIVNSGTQTSLAAQESHEVVLTKTLSGLDSSKTYRLHAWYQVSCSQGIDGATDHRYQVAIRLDGNSIGQPSLADAEPFWDVASGSGYIQFTGKTAPVLTTTAYSYDVSGTGRVYFRQMSWQLREVV
jgi:hypothetical protein